MLIDMLFEYPDGSAVVVDSSGNFDVLGVYTGILERLKRDGTEKGEAVEDVAAKMLDHVRIMRIFDFVGVREAIGEIRDELEARKITTPVKRRISTPKRPTPEPFTPKQEKRTVVADSEDEDEEEEMLFDSADTSNNEVPAIRPIPSNPPAPAKTPPPQPDPPSGKIKLILLDNLTQVLMALLKKDSIQGKYLFPPYYKPTNS